MDTSPDLQADTDHPALNFTKVCVRNEPRQPPSSLLLNGVGVMVRGIFYCGPFDPRKPPRGMGMTYRITADPALPAELWKCVSNGNTCGFERV